MPIPANSDFGPTFVPHDRPATLTEEEIERIADRAAKKAVEMMTRDAYAAVGKGVVQKTLWIIGVLALAAFIWASQHGLIKPTS